MHRQLFLIAAGSVAAAGGLLIATALPAGAATSVRAETMACTATGPERSPGFSEDTPVTFTVTSIGVLAITVPTDPVTSVVRAGAVGATITRPLGPCHGYRLPRHQPF